MAALLASENVSGPQVEEGALLLVRYSDSQWSSMLLL